MNFIGYSVQVSWFFSDIRGTEGARSALAKHFSHKRNVLQVISISEDLTGEMNFEMATAPVVRTNADEIYCKTTNSKQLQNTGSSLTSARVEPFPSTLAVDAPVKAGPNELQGSLVHPPLATQASLTH